MSTKYINYMSPRGVAKYPRLDQPYTYNTSIRRSMPDPEGQYELKAIMPAKEFAPLKAALDQAIKDSGMKPQHLPYKKEVDKDTGETTDNVEVTFRAYGKKKDGSKNTIKFFDAKGRPMPSNFPLTSGSTVKAEGWISVAQMGARLNLRQVQVINLVERASSFSAEDGFEYDGDIEEEATIVQNSSITSNNNNNNDSVPF